MSGTIVQKTPFEGDGAHATYPSIEIRPKPMLGAGGEGNSTSTDRLSWQDLVAAVPAEQWSAGTELFRQGEEVKRVCLLERGLVKVTHRNSRDEVSIIKVMSSPGYILGAPCAVLKTHFVTYTTMTEATLKPIPAERFREALQTNAHVSWQLHQMHCQEIYNQTNQEALQNGRSVRQRMEDFICQILEAKGHRATDKNVSIELPMKYAEIAQMFTSSPEHLSRIVKQMSEEGVIQRAKHRLVIPDPDKLRHTEHVHDG